MIKGKAIIIVSIVLSVSSCVSVPKELSYRFKGCDTGLSRQININGYYMIQTPCEGEPTKMFMFYPNGLFTFQACGSDCDSAIVDCFERGGNSILCQNPSWGIYEVFDDTIKTQLIIDPGWLDGGKIVFFGEYLILSNERLKRTKGFCKKKTKPHCQKANLYECDAIADFFPLETKRDWKECPWLKKKWFRWMPL